MTAVLDFLAYIRGMLAHLWLPYGFRVECCVCRKHLAGPRWGEASHGYCWKCYWAGLRKIDEFESKGVRYNGRTEER